MLYPFYPEVDLLSKGMQWQGVRAGGNDTEYAQEGWLDFRYILVAQKWAGRGHSSPLTTWFCSTSILSVCAEHTGKTTTSDIVVERGPNAVNLNTASACLGVLETPGWSISLVAQETLTSSVCCT